MKSILVLAALAGSFTFSLVPPVAQDPQDPQDPQQMAEMMQRAQKYTKPGPHHAALERFVGKWTTETRLMMGGKAMAAEKGVAEWSWLVEGRWLQSKQSGTMMGMPLTSHGWLGYDNFKQSYVATRVTSMDTAMTHAEGDMTPDDKALITYGTLDEYLTGEHDKMVKYAWRFVSDDEIHLEVHDLPIGEENTQVISVVYRRSE